MKNIRKATIKDVSRLSEILIFSKRINYRAIFNNDKVSFKEMQVFALAQEYLTDTNKLENIWVYDDEFVKRMINIENKQIKELYVDSFFVNKRISICSFNIQVKEGMQSSNKGENNKQKIIINNSNNI